MTSSAAADQAGFVLVQEADARGRVVACPVGAAYRVGREKANNELVLTERHISRRHCTLMAEADGRVRVIDHSGTGTTIKASPDAAALTATERDVASPGQTIVLGGQTALLVLGRAYQGTGKLQAPARLGERLLLARTIGKGGMGVVFEAWDEARRKRCAVKVLQLGKHAEPEDVARFGREIKLQASLKDYPGIARVYDQGTVPGSGELYCVMELVSGESLLEKLKRKDLPRTESVRIVSRVARAVEYAHGQGVVHRDLKPANVLISADGMVRLTDFGIARTLDGDGRLTSTGLMVGTPGFMCPEQIQGLASVSPATDIYGLGALLYAVLCGRPPIDGKSLADALRAVVQGKVTAPRSLDPTIDAELEELVLQALRKDAADRVPSARVFAEALEGWLRVHDPAQKVSLRSP